MKIKNILRLARYIPHLLILGILIICLSYACISWYSNKFIFANFINVPKREVGLVLGTSKYLRNKKINEFYQTRIDTAAKLYLTGKVNFLVVSGDNNKNSYNEPKQMKDDLVAAGVPAQNIQPDYAGFRTLDSILRMDKIFGHKNYVIISQEFHNQRALFIAKAKGHNPIAFNAPDPKKLGMKKVIMREFLARMLAISDIITNKKPRFYGDPIVFPHKTSNAQKTP